MLPADAVSDAKGFFMFSHGDVIAGTHARLDAAALEFFAPTLDAQVERHANDLLAWRIAQASPPANLANLSRIHLRNGDQLDVHVLALDAEWLDVETPWGTRNAVRIADLSHVTLPGETAPRYRGPQPLSDFRVANAPAASDSGWVAAEGGLFSQSQRKAALELPIPEAGDTFRIALEVLPQGFAGLSLDLTGNGPRALGPDLIWLRQRQNEITVRARSEAGSLTGGAVPLPETNTPAYRMELYVNVKENHYAVLWNGVIIREWREPPADRSESFSFDTLKLQFIGTEPILIREITLTRWNGILPPEREEPASGVAVRFQNQDNRTWPSVRIREDMLELTPETGPPFTVPLHMVAELTFARKPAPPRAPEPASVELRLALPGNRLSVAHVEMRAGLMETEHPAFRTPLQLPLRDIQGIQWVTRSHGEADIPDETPHLRMLSGENIAGHPLGFLGGRLRFQPLWSETELAIPLRNAGTLYLNNKHEVPNAPHRFRLHNRDTFPGTLLEVGENDVALLSPSGEQLRINRNALREVIRPDAALGDWIYVWGDENDWQVTQRSGRPRDPSDPARPSVARAGFTYARQLPVSPNRLMLDLHIAANENLGLLFSLFSSEPTRTTTPEGVEINMTSRQIIVRMQGELQVISFERRPDVPNRLQLFFDPEADTITVFLNGEQLPPLNVPIPVDMDARWMRFQSLSRDFPTAGLQVQPWQGDPVPSQPKADVREHDELQLADRPNLRGTLLPATEGQISFRPEGDATQLSVEIREMLRIRFASQTQVFPRRNARDVLVSLRGETQPVTLALLEGDARSIKGTGDAWPDPVAIPMPLIDAITFNPYKQQRQDKSPAQSPSLPPSRPAAE